MSDIHPDLLSPGTVELALETRREYTKKLEEVVFLFILADEVWLTSPSFILLSIEWKLSYLQAEEQARRLRADLAVEEHRVRELDRILREVLPYPKTPNIPKSRPSRKVGSFHFIFIYSMCCNRFSIPLLMNPKTRLQSSIERKRMSRRLAEDAKAYFDECVSLSTFDSSDFSSQEDPPLSMVGPPTPSRLTEASSNTSVSNFLSNLLTT